MKAQFLLNPQITYLNHGSFGACPVPVFEVYQQFQRELEYEPVQFITVRGPDLLKNSREVLGTYVGCEGDDLVYFQNPSAALNTVIKSLKLEPGDEVLTTNHEYGAMDRTWKYYCRKSGAKYIQQPISLPLQSKEQFLEEFWKGLSSRTRIVFISHITSPTALVFPVQEICQRARELGLMTIVDGAHVPAHIPLNLGALQADIYTGACHKWLLTPKGCSFLYVKKELQNLIDPLVISWGYEADFPGKSKFIDYHEFQGTRDFSAFLTVPAAIEFQQKNNWNSEQKKSKKMIHQAYHEVSELLNTSPICPVTEDFLGQMCSIPIRSNELLQLKAVLYNQYRIEIPLVQTNLDLNGNRNQQFIRISLNAYNTYEDVETLKRALVDIRQNTHLIE